MDHNRSYLIRALRLSVVSTAIMLLVAISSEAALDDKLEPLSSKGQADLGREGDEASLASLKLPVKQSDIEKVLLLKKSVLSLCPALYKEKIHSTVPKHLLVGGIIRFLRYEFGSFYQGQRSIRREEFNQALDEKIVAPCKQIHSKFGYWWKRLTEGRFKANSQFEWLIAENICRHVIHSTKSDEFILYSYEEFEASITSSLDRLFEGATRKVAAKVDIIKGEVERIDVARLSLLATCIRRMGRATNYQPLLTLDEARRSPIQLISDEGLVSGLATFMRIETGFPKSAPDQAEIEQFIEKELIKPCEPIHVQLGEMKEGDDFNWARIETVCSTFAKLVGSGESSKLLERVYAEYKKQLEADQSNPNRDAERMAFIHARTT